MLVKMAALVPSEKQVLFVVKTRASDGTEIDLEDQRSLSSFDVSSESMSWKNFSISSKNENSLMSLVSEMSDASALQGNPSTYSSKNSESEFGSVDSLQSIPISDLS